MAQWPSAELKLPGPRRARVTAALWWLFFGLALLAIGGGIYSSVDQYLHPSGIDRLGLLAERTDKCVSVTPKSHVAKAEWPSAVDDISGGCVVAIGGRAVEGSATAATIAAMIDEQPGRRVSLSLKETGKAIVVASFTRVATGGWFELILMLIDSLAAILYVGTALLLWLRRGFDPVARRMSVALLLITHIFNGPVAFWTARDFPIAYLLALSGILVMIIALPAYPSGIYVPRAFRWLRVVVPVTFIAAFAIPGAITVVMGGLLLVMVAGIALLLVRYVRMPEGLEKQQVKWTVLGLGVGLLLIFVSAQLPEPPSLAANKPRLFDLLTATYDIVNQIGWALIPAAFAASLFQFRLNDADAAAGKSLGYAIVTLIVGVVWALVQMLVSDYAKRWAGDPMITTTITTVIAALVFTPARAYVLAWTEKKFQPALVHLRKLPDKLVRWQTCDSPDELASAALADLVPGVGAAYAAVLGDDGREWRVLAAHGIEPHRAAVLLEAERPAERRDDPFPIRRELADQLGRPDLLAIGPRSDGASFTRDEKAAIAMIVEPLSNAIEAAALRERHIIKVETSLEGIDQRLARLEVELAPGSASRRSPKGSSAAGRSSRT